MTITLFEFHSTRSSRVRWTLDALGLPFESIEGVQVLHSPALQAVSPLGKVPGLVMDGRKLFESAAICTWLADSVPASGLVAASGSYERALHDQWVSFTLTEIEAHLWSSHRNTHLYPPERRVAAVLEQNADEARRALAILDAELAERPFLVGQRFSVTDIIAGFTVDWAEGVGWNDGFAGIAAYRARLLAMPLCPYRR